ncbi:MAG: InlB B-repeat-containing protein [Gallionellaceae bacterium]
MAAVQDTSHPLWDKICTFLGCLPTIDVTITPAGLAAGTVTLNPAGPCEEVDISNPPSQGCPTSGLPPVTPVVTTCSQNCTAQYTSGTAVTLTAAVAASGYTFTGWGGACAGLGTGPNGTQCTLTMQSVDANLGGYQVTANFGVVAPAYCFYTITSTITGISGLYLQVFGGVACEPTYPLYVELSNGCAEEGVCTMTILTFATLAEAYEYCANIYGPEICLEHVYE